MFLNASLFSFVLNKVLEYVSLYYAHNTCLTLKEGAKVRYDLTISC